MDHVILKDVTAHYIHCYGWLPVLSVSQLGSRPGALTRVQNWSLIPKTAHWLPVPPPVTSLFISPASTTTSVSGQSFSRFTMFSSSQTKLSSKYVLWAYWGSLAVHITSKVCVCIEWAPVVPPIKHCQFYLQLPPSYLMSPNTHWSSLAIYFSCLCVPIEKAPLVLPINPPLLQTARIH